MSSTPIVSVQDQLADQFRRRIWSGQYQPGQHLREEPLARQLGVSRGPIRDTFLRLTKEGLLEARPNAGVRVAAAPSGFKRRTLVRLRRTIECSALDLILRSDQQALMVTLQENLASYRKVCRAESLEDVVVLDIAFHQQLVAAADGGSLLETWRPVVSQMFLRYSRHHSLMESYREHAAIVAAMREVARSEAVRALRRHIV